MIREDVLRENMLKGDVFEQHCLQDRREGGTKEEKSMRPDHILPQAAKYPVSWTRGSALQILRAASVLPPLGPSTCSCPWCLRVMKWPSSRKRKKANEQQMSPGRVFLFWCWIGLLIVRLPLKTATPWSNHALLVISHLRTLLLDVALPKLWTCPVRVFSSAFISSELAGW